MARKMKKLTVARLRAWLESQPPSAEFTTASPSECPIAAFIDEDHKVGTEYIAEHGANYDWSGLPPNDPRRIELPSWARAFIGLVDRHPGGMGRSIKRDEVLRILDSVTPKRKG